MEITIDRESVENLIKNYASAIKLERLKRPFSMLSPEPVHFPRFSKLEGSGFKAQQVLATGLEIDALHEHYGMPRDIPQMLVTVAGLNYGQEFKDFTIEMFGLKGDENEPDEINRLAERTIGKTKVSNADPDSLPFGAGLSFSINHPDSGKCIVKIHVWRWRVFMNDSSLCLENNWQTNKLTGGAWIPYLLGIVYANPKKMVEDMMRFAPALKLCNLVDAKLPITGRPPIFSSKEEFLTALDQAAMHLDGQTLTQPNVGALIGADERQIRLWCDKFEVNWSSWKREQETKRD